MDNIYYGKEKSPGLNDIREVDEDIVEESFPPFPKEFNEKINYLDEINPYIPPEKDKDNYEGKHFYPTKH